MLPQSIRQFRYKFTKMMNMEVITIESVAYQQLMGRIESIASHIERLETTRSVQGIPDTLA